MDSIAIQPIGAFRATLTPPGSKSLTNRALLLAALAEGSSELSGVLFSDDSRVMLAALQRLGLVESIDEAARVVRVTGGAGKLPTLTDDEPLFLGNAGTAYRFLTAACCVGQGRYTLTGIERMKERPIGQLVDALRELGASVSYEQNDGYPPVTIDADGSLVGGDVTLPTTLSSQYISALLQVAPCTEQGITLRFEGAVTSRPYVEMTLGLMAQFGVTAVTDPMFTTVTVKPGRYLAVEHAIEPDASNASYFLAAAAALPGSKCTVEGLGFRSLQGDAWFAERVLQPMGASVIYEPDAITVIAPPEGQPLKGIDVDLNAMPDMAQTLAVIALFADGPTTMRDIGNLRVKETDRMAALQNELTKLGAEVTIDGDDMTIQPPAGGVDGKLTPASIDTYDDHRMAMSFAVAGLRSEGVVINDPSCVNKTFPDYFEYLDRLATPAAP